MSEDKQPYDATRAGTQPCREKYWDELSIEEKIERTRWVVKTRMDGIERRLQRIDALLTRLENHKHDGTGRVMVPLADDMAAERHFGMRDIEPREGKEFF